MKITEGDGALPFKFQDISARLPRRSEWRVRRFSDITDITIHHSGASARQSPETIARWHVAYKRWPGIGYHYLVYPDGAVYQCNEDLDVSYHNGFSNRSAIGICCVGNFEAHEVPSAQWVSAVNLVRTLKRLYRSIETVTAHREYRGATLCPGKHFDIRKFRAETETPAAHKDALRAEN